MIRFRPLIALAFIVIAVVPVLMLGGWVANSAFNQEMSGVRQKHAVVARNLTAALSVYVNDLTAVFRSLTADIKQDAVTEPSMALAQALNFRHLCVASAAGTIDMHISLPDGRGKCVSGEALAQLRERTEYQEIAFSDVFGDYENRPTIYIGQRLRDGNLSVGAFSTKTIVEFQTQISFDKQGHAAIVDKSGNVIAHPNLQWQAEMKNIAAVKPVALMMKGETGVTRFFSPAAKKEMVSAYTAVPRVGWGVMVPQPIEELQARAADIREAAALIMVVGLIIAAAMSWYLSGVLLGPLSSTMRSFREFAEGDLDARSPAPGRFVPQDIRELGRAFNGMIDTIASSISERKQAEEALRLSEAELRKAQARLLDAIENLPVGFDLYDQDERLILFNEKVLVNNALKGTQKIGMLSGDVGLQVAQSGVVADAVGREVEWADARLAAFRSDTPTTIKTTDGRSILVENKTTSEGGRVVIRIDLTELLSLQEQLRNSQKLEALGQLTSGIAHEFNNMLQAISGYLEFLNSAFSEDEKNSQLVGRALRVVQGGASLTQSLLAYVGKGPLEAQVTDIGYLLSDITKLLRPTLGETVHIETRLDGQIWPVKIDPGQLQAAIINLATNSRDAMPDGGTLSIEVKNLSIEGAGSRGRFYQASRGDYVQIAVTDTGTGMPSEIIDQVTDPFFTTKAIGSGTGLGLSMVDGFIHRQSGGYVDIDSTPGEGTTITLLLPRATEMAEIAEPSTTGSPAVNGGDHEILLVEDDPAVLDALQQVLVSSGYAVRTATDCDEAQQLFRDGISVDLLLTDIVIPGKLSGADLAQEIKDTHPDMKVVLMTGYAEGDIISRGIGTSDYRLLRKPVGIDKLLDTLTEVLDGPS